MLYYGYKIDIFFVKSTKYTTKRCYGSSFKSVLPNKINKCYSNYILFLYFCVIIIYYSFISVYLMIFNLFINKIKSTDIQNIIHLSNQKLNTYNVLLNAFYIVNTFYYCINGQNSQLPLYFQSILLTEPPFVLAESPIAYRAPDLHIHAVHTEYMMWTRWLKTFNIYSTI